MGPSGTWSKRALDRTKRRPSPLPPSQCSPHSPLLRFAFQMACSLSVFGRSGSKQIPTSTKLASCMHSGVALSSQNMRFWQPGDQPATKTPLCLSHFAPVRNPSGVALSHFPHFWNPTATISPHAHSRLPRIRTSPLRSRRPRVKKSGKWTAAAEENDARRTSKSIPDQQEHCRAKACLQKYCGEMTFWSKRRNERALAKTLQDMNAPPKTPHGGGRSSATGSPARWVGWLRYAGLCGV